MLKDSHTSVIGMRSIAKCEQVLILPKFECIEEYFCNKNLKKYSVLNKSTSKRNLFVLTAMSNFCGQKYDLKIIKKIRKGNILIRFRNFK